MKRISLSILCTVLTYLSLFAHNPNQLSGLNKLNRHVAPGRTNSVLSIPVFPDSTICYGYDSLHPSWNVYSRTTTHYDSTAHNYVSIDFILNGSTWVNSKYTRTTYNSSGNLTEEFYQTWDGTAWQPDSRDLYGYDVNNNFTKFLHLFWNGSSYDTSYQQFANYDSNNHRTLILTRVNTSGVWTDNNRRTYVYDSNGNETNSLLENWNGTSWDPTFRDSSAYDVNNNLIVKVFENYVGTVWEKNDRATYTYDSNNLLLSILEEFWDGQNWITDSIYYYTYNPDGTIRTDTHYGGWNGTIFQMGDSCNNYYSPTTGIHQFSKENVLISAFPNPFTGYITVELNAMKNKSDFTFELYNILNQKIFSMHVSDGKNQIDASKIENGTFMYVIKSGREIIYRDKLIKQ